MHHANRNVVNRAQPVQPDPAIAAGNAAIAAEARICPPAGDPRADCPPDATNEWAACMERLTTTPATSLAGLKAKARALEESASYDISTPGLALASLVQDVIRLATPV